MQSLVFKDASFSIVQVAIFLYLYRYFFISFVYIFLYFSLFFIVFLSAACRNKNLAEIC